MLRRTPLYQATQLQQVGSGVQPDLQSVQKVLWESAIGVSFRNGKIVRKVPAAALFSAGTLPVIGLGQQRASNGVKWVWAASGGRIVRWSGGAVEQIIASATINADETSIAPATQVDFTFWGDWTLINTGIGAAQLHKPGVSLGPIAEAPTDVVQFQKKNNILMAIGTVTAEETGRRGNAVAWSEIDDIETWTPTTTNAAGSLSIDDMDTKIKAAHRLGQATSVYGEDQLALINFINAPFYFGQRLVLDGIGCVGKKAVCGYGSGNYGFGITGAWWTDGNSFRYIDEGFIREYFQSEVNWSQASKVQVCRNDFTGCIDFYFPMRSSTEINEGWTYDPRTSAWNQIPAQPQQDERRLFQRPLVGGQGGVAGNIGLDEFDTALASPLSLVSKPLLMQYQDDNGLRSAHLDSKIDEVELLLHEAVGVQFRLRSAQHSSGPFSDTAWIDIDAGKSSYPLPHGTPSGVYWKIEFRSVLTNWKINLQGFLLFGTMHGTKRGLS